MIILIVRYWILMESQFMRFVSPVKSLEEGRGRSLPVEFLSPVVVEAVDALIVEDSLGRHEVFVKVAGLGVLPLGVMQHLVSNVHHVIDLGEISHVCVGSEVVSQVNFSLFGSGSVLAA